MTCARRGRNLGPSAAGQGSKYAKTRCPRQKSPKRVSTRVSGPISQVGSVELDFCRTHQTKPILAGRDSWEILCGERVVKAAGGSADGQKQSQFATPGFWRGRKSRGQCVSRASRPRFEGGLVAERRRASGDTARPTWPRHECLMASVQTQPGVQNKTRTTKVRDCGFDPRFWAKIRAQPG
jgi:hypothetical protein